MLLDLIDFLEPTMAIVGSRGLGQLKGILLGSTSHYLVQKSSVPVMVSKARDSTDHRWHEEGSSVLCARLIPRISDTLLVLVWLRPVSKRQRRASKRMK